MEVPPQDHGAGSGLDADPRSWYPENMAIDLTHPPPSAIDVSGLSPDAVQAVESLVTHLRVAGGQLPTDPYFGTNQGPTDDEFDRSLRELASGPPVPTLPADWSRADLYEDHD